MSRYEDSIVKIKIVGVGGGGKNAVERMLETDISMVEYITINTDDKAYHSSHAGTKLQIGKRETGGHGAGANPEKGFLSAQENRKELKNVIKDCDMLFIACGMGGGTGTGASPIVAEIAKKAGILTVAVVTTPFSFEGRKRMKNALAGIEKLRENVDSIIVIPNDNLKHVSQTRITLNNAFAVADDVLVQTVKDLVEVIQKTAYINCDFSDICSVVKDSGDMYTTSKTFKIERIEEAIEEIKSSSLLGSSVDGTSGILLCISAGKDIGLEDIDKVSSAVSNAAAPDANFIFGMNFDETMDDTVKVVLLATKKEKEEIKC